MADPAQTPDLHRRFVRRVLFVLGLLVLVGLSLTVLGLAWTAILTLFGGALIGVLLEGVSSKISTWTKIPRRIVLILVLLLTVGAVIGAGMWLGPALADQAEGLREQMTQSWQDLRAWLETRAWGQQVLDELSKLEFESFLTPSFGGVLSTAVGSVASVVLMFVFGVDPDIYLDGFARLFPPPRRHRVRKLASSVALALRRWLIGRFLSMTVVGIGTALGLWIAGVPLSIPLGTLAGILSFVPNLGPLLAALPGILVGLSVDLQTAIWAVVVYAAVQALENYAITPFIQRRVVSIPPALLLAVQVLMGLSAGVIGLFMATPLLVIVIVLVQAVYLREILGDDITLIGEHEPKDQPDNEGPGTPDEDELDADVAAQSEDDRQHPREPLAGAQRVRRALC